MMNIKLGKKAAVLRKDTKKLKPLLSKSNINIPDNFNWLNGVQWPMWCNDTIGCCTQVSVASAIRVWTKTNNNEVLLRDIDVIKNYSDESGYIDGISGTDNGAVEVEVIRRWITQGYQTPKGIDKLVDFGYLNPRNQDVIKTAICLFGGIYIGISVPNYALSSQNNTWELETTNNQIAGGHAIYIHGYDTKYLYLNTWGREWKMSWDFMKKYCDEAYGLISNNWLSNNTSPFYESLIELKSELDNID